MVAALIDRPLNLKGNAMRYTAIIFDIDGTLVDSTQAIHDALQMVAVDIRGYRLTPQEMELGLSLPAPQALAAVGLPSNEETVNLWLDHEYELWGDEVGPFEGVEELLNTLASQGIAMGAVTSETSDEMHRGFARFAIREHMSEIITADDTERHKPDPDPLLACLERMGITPHEALYVGDSIADGQCAQAAGADFALACWRQDPVTEQLSCRARLSSPLEVLNLLSCV